MTTSSLSHSTSILSHTSHTITPLSLLFLARIRAFALLSKLWKSLLFTNTDNTLLSVKLSTNAFLKTFSSIDGTFHHRLTSLLGVDFHLLNTHLRWFFLSTKGRSSNHRNTIRMITTLQYISIRKVSVSVPLINPLLFLLPIHDNTIISWMVYGLPLSPLTTCKHEYWSLLTSK